MTEENTGNPLKEALKGACGGSLTFRTFSVRQPNLGC